MKSTSKLRQQASLVADEDLFKPEEMPLERPDCTPADKDFSEKTIELTDYLRKKSIHAQIFKKMESNIAMDPKTGN